MPGSKDVLKKKKKKTLGDRFASMTYMQASLYLFAASILLFALCLWRSVATGGEAGMLAAFVSMLDFLVAAFGVAVTLYGHFSVGVDGKLSWKLGVLLNGAMALFLLLLYLYGLIGG